MNRWKADQGRGREKRKIRRKEDGNARKGRKLAKHCVFPMICGSGGSCGASWPDKWWKIARRCGAKQISKSKCTKHTSVGSLLEVKMSKKCTPLWREAHFQVKMYKTLGVRTIFGGSDIASPLRFTTLRCSTPRSTILHYITLHSTTLQLHN